jgi:3-oxoacyl-(acyl-carrier-protein) synthase
MLFPFGINAFNSLGALAEGHSAECKLAPFDQNRGGTLLGEGSAYVLMTSKEKARELGLKPLCQIIGYASSLDGYHPVKPHPEGRGANTALRRALADGKVVPDEVDYVNAHGSGTYHNDLVEALVINEVFSKGERQVPVSSTKPFYGHLLTAGGAIELLSLLFAFDRDLIPPTLNLDKLDESCDIDCVDKTRSSRVDVAVSNSFGLHGQNGVLVLRAIENG